MKTTGDSQEEVIIFRDIQTDRHHDIYIIITTIIIKIVLTCCKQTTRSSALYTRSWEVQSRLPSSRRTSPCGGIIVKVLLNNVTEYGGDFCQSNVTKYCAAARWVGWAWWFDSSFNLARNASFALDTLLFYKYRTHSSYQQLTSRQCNVAKRWLPVFVTDKQHSRSTVALKTMWNWTNQPLIEWKTSVVLKSHLALLSNWHPVRQVKNLNILSKRCQVPL